MYNPNQIFKNLPLKKRRVYFIDSPITNGGLNENHSREIPQFYSPQDLVQKQISSSHYLELLRQQHIYLSANLQQNHLHSSSCDHRLTQNVCAQQYPDNYRVLNSQQTCNSTKPKVDEQARQNNHRTFSDRYSTSDGSSIEQTFVDSIEEHFARSLAKFSSFNPEETSATNSQITASVVDEHFAKALGSTIWEKLKEKV